MEIGGITMILRVKKLLMVLLASVLALSMGVAIAMNMPTVRAEGDVALSISMEDGLSVRTKDPIGIRFRTYVNKDYVDANQDNIEIVVMITPTRNLSGKTFDANFDGENKKIVFSKAIGNLVDNGDYEVPGDETNYWYHACITNLQEQNIARDFSAISYVLYDGVLLENSYTEIAQGNAWNSAKAYLEDDTVVKTETDIANAQALCASNVATIKGFDNETFEVTVKRGQTVAQALEGVDLAEELNVEGAAYYKGIVEDANVTLTENTEFTAKMNALAFAHSGDRWNAGENYGVAIGTLTAEDTTVIKVPETYNGKPVTCTQRYAFRHCTFIEKVYLPKKLTTLAGRSFEGCTNLNYIDARGVTYSAYTVVEGDVTLFNDGNFIFYNCDALTTAIFGESLSIKDNAQVFFTDTEQDNGQLNIYLYSLDGKGKFTSNTYVQNLLSGNVYNYYNEDGVCGSWCFTDETETAVELAGEHEYEKGACKKCDADQTAGINYKYDSTLGGYVVYSGTSGVAAYSGTDTEVYVREYYNGPEGNHKVVALGKRSFYNCSHITKVIVPDTVKTVGGVAFAGCTSLEYVDIRGWTKVSGYNDSIAGITSHDSIFRDCVALTTLIVGANFDMSNGNWVFNQSEGQPAPAEPQLHIYLDSIDGKVTYNSASDYPRPLLASEVYHRDENGTCGTWDFTDETETAVKLAGEHEYENGACKNCDADQTTGIKYVYDATLGENGGYVVFGGYRTSAYTGTDKEVYIRATYNDGTNQEKPVVGIGKWAFWNNTSITKVIAPSVKYVGGVAFAGCTSLNYVDLRSFEEYDYQVSIAGYSEHDSLFRDCIALETLILGPSFRMDDEVAIFNVESQTAPESPKLNIYLSSAEGTFTTKTTANVLLSVNVYYLSNDNKPTDTTKTYWHYDKETDLAVLWE